MKIALCLFGNVGIKQNAALRSWSRDVKMESKEANVDPKIAFRHYKKSLLDIYDVDVFIHSWSKDYEEQLIDLYHPKDYIIEEQKDFPMDLSLYGMSGNDPSKWKISESAMHSCVTLLPSRGGRWDLIMEELRRHTFRTTSRWYSNSKTLEIMDSYSAKNEINYDFVITSRIDCCFKKPFSLESLDPSKFYASRRIGREDENYALYDFWFMSDQKNMKEFSKIYNHVYDYSIRPVYACREHVDKFIGSEKIVHLLTNNVDYRKP